MPAGRLRVAISAPAAEGGGPRGNHGFPRAGKCDRPASLAQGRAGPTDLGLGAGIGQPRGQLWGGPTSPSHHPLCRRRRLRRRPHLLHRPCRRLLHLRRRRLRAPAPSRGVVRRAPAGTGAGAGAGAAAVLSPPAVPSFPAVLSPSPSAPGAWFTPAGPRSFESSSSSTASSTSTASSLRASSSTRSTSGSDQSASAAPTPPEDEDQRDGEHGDLADAHRVPPSRCLVSCIGLRGSRE